MQVVKDAKEIAKLIVNSEKIILFHHVNPDGDSIGCSYGLLKAIKSKYPKKKVIWYCYEQYIKDNFGFLDIDYDLTVGGDFKIDDTWTAIVGDCGNQGRVYGFDVYKNAGKKVCFDHHENEVDFEVDLYWRISDLSASAIQAFWIAKELGVEFSNDFSIIFFLGIYTDTGGFKYCLNDKRTFDAAAELAPSIDSKKLDKLYRDMSTRTKKEITFNAWVLTNYKNKKGVAWISIEDKDFEKFGFKYASDAKNITLLSGIEGIDIWLFFVEDVKENNISVSLRSYGPHVDEIANQFNGGGHNRAAGCKIKSFKEVDKVIDSCIEKIKEYK